MRAPTKSQNVPSSAYLGLRGPIWSSQGLQGLQGSAWAMHTTTQDLYGPTTVGSIWTYQNIYGPTRTYRFYMGLLGPKWGLLGPTQAYKDMPGPTRAYLGLPGHIWAYQVITGPVKGPANVCQDLPGPARTYLGLLGNAWSHKGIPGLTPIHSR